MRFLLFLTLIGTLCASEVPRLVSGVDSVGITVSDLDRAVAFYTNVLSFEKTSELEVHGEEYERLQGVFGLRKRTARLRLGGEFIELTEYLAPKGRPVPGDSRGNDHWFQHIAIVTSDMERAYRHLRAHRIEHASTGPQLLPAWNEKAGGIQAFYFRDPDGHFLEILSFPPDKGAAQWHKPSESLFLGIDHTAFVISDTERSLRFYRDALGLEVAGESENYGPEQERLNNVFGARLRITTLRGTSGPGVELLEYLAPKDGRPYPADARANDLIHWQTRFVGASAEKAALRFREIRSTLISSGAVEVPGGRSGKVKSVVARDPDGHAIEVAEIDQR